MNSVLRVFFHHLNDLACTETNFISSLHIAHMQQLITVRPKVLDFRWKNLSDALHGLRLSRLKMCAQISLWRMALVVAERTKENGREICALTNFYVFAHERLWCQYHIASIFTLFLILILFFTHLILVLALLVGLPTFNIFSTLLWGSRH